MTLSMDNCGDFSNEIGLSLERELLINSGLFDESAYLSQAGREACPDPIGHYLRIGWRVGLEPNPSFPGSLLMPCFATLGFDIAPAIAWLIMGSADWCLPERRDVLESSAARLRNTGLFDEAFYRSQMGRAAIGVDPAIHYLAVGERMGIAPSAQFDPGYYRAAYPDVAGSGLNCLLHYVEHGRAEGRYSGPARVSRPGQVAIDPAKGNVIVVVHETSRTGAPILGWNIATGLAKTYNIFTVRLGDGDLTRQFEALSAEVYGPFLGSRRNEIDIEYSLKPLLDARKYRYVIVNSAEGRLIIEPCVRRYIPTVLLMHEFGSYLSPLSSVQSALDLSTEVVFSARLVARAAEEVHPNLRARSYHVMPQGMSILPASQTMRPSDGVSDSTLKKLTYEHEVKGCFIVIGLGFVHIRKGVDQFISTAAAVIRRQPRRPVHFLWVGDGYRPREDFSYSVYLHEQVNRSGMNEHVTFLDGVPDLEPVYRIADAFLLSSRLDPLPNVTIDAAFRGIPVICFKEASGMADLMLTSPQTAKGVVDYLDADSAGDVIFELAEDEASRLCMAEAMRDLAHANFDMKTYVSRLDAVGTAAAALMSQRLVDAKTLINDPTFDQEMFLGTSRSVETRDVTIARYLTIASARGWDTLPDLDHRFRRPAPGFNPRVYAAANASRLVGGVDPLADFVRRGRPVGTWQAAVLRPEDPDDEVTPIGRLKVALHAHFFYPELCSEFLFHLATNQTRCDLMISTDNSIKAGQLRRVLRSYTNGQVEIRVVPNRGRDLGPLLSEFAEDLADYDLIGHVHAKRSPYVGDPASDQDWGDTWREFLWQNLLGGLHPMMDRIVAAFEHREGLGLVFPSDPNLIGWGDNRVQAAEIARSMGWTGQLSDHFDFPLGTMFWMRLNALRPLVDLRLGWNDYSEEPLAYDGTLLHALERLPTIACQLAGFTYAVTHVRGVSWMPPT